VESKWLTIDEIEATYPDEWVLVLDPQPEDSPEVEAGIVAFHSPDREALERFADRIDMRSGAIFFVWGDKSRAEAPFFVL